MKIKNIVAGDFVQVKKSLCYSEFKAKQVCEVIDVDPTDKYGFDVLIQGKNCLDWVNHKNLKKYIERDIAKELLEVDLSSELTGSDLTRSILSKQFMQACLVSDSSDKAARQGDDLQLIRMYNETNGKFISMRDPWHGCHHKYAVAVDNNRKPLTAADLGL